jgi:hypothetical protein
MWNAEADQAAGTNAAATWSLVLGIVGIVLVLFVWWLGAILGIGALVWGFVGMGRYRQNGIGRGKAIAGLILGAVTVVLVILRIGTIGL